MPRLKIVKRLGQGGFGLVYMGHDARRGPVAVKVAGRPSLVKDLRREAQRMQGNVKNRYAVQVIGAHLTGSTPFIVMELCSGGSLRPYAGRMHWSDVARVMRDVAKGLLPLHRKGGCHQDIKPDNLLAWRPPDQREWRVKIGDYGLARSGPAPKGDNEVAGTPGYMAPEGVATPASDIFALGITTIEMISGKRNVGALNGLSIPPAFANLLRGMVHPDPAQRPSTELLIRQVNSFARLRPLRAVRHTLGAIAVCAIVVAVGQM